MCVRWLSLPRKVFLAYLGYIISQPVSAFAAVFAFVFVSAASFLNSLLRDCFF